MFTTFVVGYYYVLDQVLSMCITFSLRPQYDHTIRTTTLVRSRNLLRSCQSFGQTDMKILSDRKIFCRSENKSPPVMCIMFSLAFLECFTIVLAIGHLISPLVFIEVKVIQFLVFSVAQNCICYVFYSVCLVFGLSSFLDLSQSIECKFFTIRQYLWRHSDSVKFYNSNNIHVLITSISNFFSSSLRVAIFRFFPGLAPW